MAALAGWAEVTAARLDLDAVQETPLVFAAGQRLRPGVAIGAVGESLDRLRYREVSTAPAQPGEFRRTRERWEIHLRAREDVAHPAMRVRLELQGSRIVGVTNVAGGADMPGAELEPELLVGVGETGFERRRPLALAEMSHFVPGAVLAAEDHRFFDHEGLDLLAIGRALAVNTSRGEIAQGASTLTQQLVKNLVLGPERTWSRKVREGALALALERRHPKERILEAYLNTVYLGQRGRAAILGVGAAAQSYWGKDARHLTLAESALLAGMIRAPNRYSPAEHPERARRRRDVVLRRMHELGMIDEAALAAAAAERVHVRAGTALPSQAPYFLDHVRAATGADLGAGSPRIYTTLDTGLQRAAEAAVARGLDRLESAHRGLRRSPSGGRLQAAVVALDPATGAIRAFVGGRDYELSAFNRVTHARRQPGSAFKPFVFLAALRRGVAGQSPVVTPASLVEDLPVELETPQGVWAPRNFEDRFDGLITVRQALERSSNVAAVRIAQAVGLGNVVRTARDVGLTSRISPVPALALGSFEVTPLELATAYATLANGGMLVGPHAVRAVEGRGRVSPVPPECPVSCPRKRMSSRTCCAGSWTVVRAPRSGPSASVAPSRGRPAPRTTRAMRGSPATRLAWWRWSGSDSTTVHRSACRAAREHCRSGPTSCGRPRPSRSRGSSPCHRPLPSATSAAIPSRAPSCPRPSLPSPVAPWRTPSRRSGLPATGRR